MTVSSVDIITPEVLPSEILPLPVAWQEVYYSHGAIFVPHYDFDQKYEQLKMGRFHDVFGTSLKGVSELSVRTPCSIEYFETSPAYADRGGLIVTTRPLPNSVMRREIDLFTHNGGQYKARGTSIHTPAYSLLVVQDPEERAVGVFATNALVEPDKNGGVQMEMNMFPEPIKNFRLKTFDFANPQSPAGLDALFEAENGKVYKYPLPLLTLKKPRIN